MKSYKPFQGLGYETLSHSVTGWQLYDCFGYICNPNFNFNARLRVRQSAG
jgi:hypothetical protein